MSPQPVSMETTSLLLPTAYAPPLVYMALLYTQEGARVLIEGKEHIVKQSWRNRCDILTAQGVQSLTIPIERPSSWRTPIREVLISSHGDWRHQHAQALCTNYGCSPYFEYYWDDLRPYYERHYRYLWDYNIELLETLCRLMHIEVELTATESFTPYGTYEGEDWRTALHPRRLDRKHYPMKPSYYQPFGYPEGFVPELSVYDLLMNKGPESLLYLRDYAHSLLPKHPLRDEA